MLAYTTVIRDIITALTADDFGAARNATVRLEAMSRFAPVKDADRAALRAALAEIETQIIMQESES